MSEAIPTATNDKPNAPEMIPEASARTLAMWMHLSALLPGLPWLLPVIIWVTNRAHSLRIDREGKKVVNFTITMTIIGAFALPLIGLPPLGIMLAVLVGLAIVINAVISAIRTRLDRPVHYPLAIPFFR